jgi:hypothetical protein
MATFRDIPKYTQAGNYEVSVPWQYLKDWLKRNQEDFNQSFSMDPDFQRGHVWSESQQIRYVEFILRGGNSSKVIYWNHPGWMRDWKGEMVLVDGKQRLSAVLRFLDNEIPAFGALYSEYTDHIRICEGEFRMNVNDLRTRAAVLQWYLDLNAGGVVHTSEEIEKVRRLLDEENKTK